MSRIGMQPITIEDGVTVSVNAGEVIVAGPKGELKTKLPAGIKVEVKENEVHVTRESEDKQTKSVHGTIRSILDNNVKGVKEGFEKKLQLVGVGYRVAQQGANISMKLGWTHPIVVEPVDGITLEVPDETNIIVKGIDKQLVGEFAAKIREIRKPEPYKGKGIKYAEEVVRRKARKVATA